VSSYEICYIHKLVYDKTVLEKPIPFVGMTKLITYKCPMCAIPIEETIFTEKEKE